MELRHDEPGVRGSGTLGQTGSTQICELDLYDELVNFSALSPEEQRRQLKRVERSSDPHVVIAKEPDPVSFDFIERSDLPASSKPAFNRSAEPAFSLFDESLFELLDQRPEPPPVETFFAFVEEPAQHTSPSIEGNHLACELNDSLKGTSPLEDICSGTMLSPETTLTCESCGAASNLEDLFCAACGQLLGELDS